MIKGDPNPAIKTPPIAIRIVGKGDDPRLFGGNVGVAISSAEFEELFVRSTVSKLISLSVVFSPKT